MAMCKKCKEIFPPQDMQEGYCKGCITPELLEEDKRLKEEESKKRPLSITVTSILVMLVSVFSLYGLYIGRGDSDIVEMSDMLGVGAYQQVVSSILAIVQIVGAIGLFQMKKWGAYIVLAVQIYNVIASVGLAIYVGVSLGSIEVFGISIVMTLLFSIINIIIINIIYKHLNKMK